MIKRFIQFYKPHKWLFILDITVAIGASVISIFFPYLTRLLLKEYIPTKNLEMIITMIVTIAGIYVLTAIFSYMRIKWGHMLGVRMEYDMRDTMFRHLQKLSFNYYDNVKTGHIMSRISNDLNMITEIAHHAPEDLIISIVIIVGAFFFMFAFHAKLAIISLVPIPIMILWGGVFGKRMKSIFKEIRKKIADINSTVENSIQGIREVKSYANEELEIEKFASANWNFRKSKESAFTLMGFFFSFMHFLRDCYYLVVIAAGIFFIYQGEIDTADLLAFLLYIGIILPPIDRLTNFIEYIYQGAASFERFTEIMDIEPDIKDRKNARSYSPVKGQVDIENITFKYEGSPDIILNDVSMQIPAGKSAAIVGESGAGKSTIVSLIPRFYEPQKGNISIDGHSIYDLKQRFLRENIGLVQQNVFLFDSTIRDNIVYGKSDATEEEIINAAKNANIYDFIMSLPEKFETLVGERGIKLSGGQKQRISIARVFLKNPPILIFDEATSSLDTESEKMIQDAMIKLSENRTTIIIAHRLSTVQHVDNIYVMKEGRIVENGNHRELLDNKGYYYQLNFGGKL